MSGMSFMPGDLVRRAAAGVTSVASSVAMSKKRHDSQGSRHSFYEANLISNAKEKCSLTVKCTPSKDASTTADLAIKSGFLMKRNEQGTWQKRFLCIVPHMFLYYFDSEQGEAPRGIIDLELYHNTEREEHGIRLVPADETLRSFHFDDDDEENLNDWATSLIRDRYHMVCEERNAYQQMQSLMTGAIDTASSAQKTSEKEREQLERQLSETEQAYLEARRLLQSSLVELGISEEEISNMTDVTRMGTFLQNRIADVRSGYERKFEDFQELMNAQQAEYAKMTEEFLKKMENEQLARKNLEALILKERKESEKKVKEAEAQIDNITLNFQMAVAAKTTSETKANTLQEQKKLLVKEVKQLRKRVDELSVSSEELKSLNAKLLKASLALKQKISILTNSNNTAVTTSTSLDEASPVRDKESEEKDPLNSPEKQETGDSPSQELEELLKFTDELIATSLQFSPSVTTSDHPTSTERGEGDLSSRSKSPAIATSTNSSNPLHLAMNLFRSTGSEVDMQEKTPSDRHLSDEMSRNNSIVGDDYLEERSSWEMPPMALRELGWLSEEQNKLMEKRLGEQRDDSSGHGVSPAAFKRSVPDETHSTGHEEGRRGSTLGLFTGFLGVTSSSSSTLGDANTATNSSAAPRRSSLLGIPSLFNKKEKEKQPVLNVNPEEMTTATSTASVTASGTSKTEDLFFSSPFTSPTEDQEERLPHAMRLHCLRCNGTVEGPKFSTCKCSTPALTPEDLTSDRLSSFTGMLKGGIFKATGLYSTTTPGTSASGNNPSTPTVTHNSNEISL